MKLKHDIPEFKYGHSMGFPSKCHFQVYQNNSESISVAVITELNDNTGASVTSAITVIVDKALAEGLIDYTTFFIEHYPPRPNAPETFDFVSMYYIDGEFSHPVWRRMTIEQVNSLINS